MKNKIWIFFLFLASYGVSFSQSKMEWVCPITDGSEVLFTGNEFVGLSYESAITSPDGIVWTRHYAYGLELMAYGLDGFVAFNRVNNQSMYFSPDGKEWKRLESVPYRTLSALSDIVFGNNVFVAVTASGKIFISSDRLNWGVVYNNDNDSTNGLRLQAVAWGGGLFVATGMDARSNVIAISPDGTHWNFERNVPALDLKSIAYGNGRFVACAAMSNDYCFSSDGKNWERSSLPVSGFDGDDPYVGFVNSSFYVFSTYGKDNFTSTDGVAWKPFTGLPVYKPMRSIAYGKNRYVVVGEGGVFTSGNGAEWENVGLLHTTYDILSVTSNGEMFLASDYVGLIHVSRDGRNWEVIASNDDAFISLAYGNGRFVGVVSGSRPGKLASSVDGKKWVIWSDDTLQNMISTVVFGNGRFVAVENGLSYVSTDGQSWTKVDMSPSILDIESVCYANGLFIACGDSILTSIDGMTWTTVKSKKRYGPNKLIGYGNNTYVGIQNEQVCSSKDLIEWNYVNQDIDYYVDGTFGYGNFVIAGKNGYILTSADGVIWTEKKVVNASFRGVTCGLNRFVAVGDRGNIAVGAADKPEPVRYDVPRNIFDNRLKTAFSKKTLSVFLPSEFQAKQVHVRIYTIQGRMVYDCKTNPNSRVSAISIKNLEKGMYVITVSDGVSSSVSSGFVVTR